MAGAEPYKGNRVTYGRRRRDRALAGKVRGTGWLKAVDPVPGRLSIGGVVRRPTRRPLPHTALWDPVAGLRFLAGLTSQSVARHGDNGHLTVAG